MLARRVIGRNRGATTGHTGRGSLANSGGREHAVRVTDLRIIRRAMDLTQLAMAEALSIPLNTLRMWDSGFRRTPNAVMDAARALGAEHRRQRELLPVAKLAAELGVHKSTLEVAIRSGRLPAHFSKRSVFGRPIRYVARGDGERFRHTAYGRRHSPAVCAPPVAAPPDYPEQLTRLRCRLGITQTVLADRIGAANKAVVHQWESRKRIPSPVFWEKIRRLTEE